MRNMTRNTDSMVKKINFAETKKSKTIAVTEMPYQFKPNVLNREQLNDVLDMKEVKKLIQAKKRG